MRTTFTLLLLTLISLSSLQAQWGWGSQRIKGDGNVVTQSRALDDFDGIKACCSLDVELTQGNTYSVEVRADENLQEYVTTEVRGDVLNIGYESNVSLSPTKPIVVYVTLPDLTLIDASSSASIMTMGQFRGDRLKMESSSGSKIDAKFAGNSVSADASSGGRIHVDGDASAIEAEASSGARVLADGLAVKRAEADVSSGASIRVNASEEIKADASSGGSVKYSGNPGNVDADTSSGGSVRKW